MIKGGLRWNWGSSDRNGFPGNCISILGWEAEPPWTFVPYSQLGKSLFLFPKALLAESLLERMGCVLPSRLKAARHSECVPCQHTSPQMAGNSKQCERVQINGKQCKIKHSVCEPYLPTNGLREEIGKKSSKINFFQEVNFILLGEQENLGRTGRSYTFHPKLETYLFYRLKRLDMWELPFWYNLMQNIHCPISFRSFKSRDIS